MADQPTKTLLQRENRERHLVIRKGVTAGYAPLGGVLVSDEIRNTLDEAGSFPHVFTYVNNPVATRVASTALDIIEEEKILEHVTEMGAYLENKSRMMSNSHL